MHNTGPDPDADPGDMQSHPDDPTRRQIEQLLDGDPSGSAALGRLLDAARQSGARADTAGLDQVLVYYAEMVAGPTVVPSPPNRSRLRAVLAKLAAAKMLVIGAFAVVATGGIALAATTGTIPNPLPGSSHQTATTASPATAPESIASSPAANQPRAPGAASPSPDAASIASSGSASSAGPAPSLSGLCQSWLARPHTNGNADNSAAFSVLIAAAGGVESVDAYCATLLTAASSDSAASHPGQPSTGTSSPATATPSGQKTHSNGKVTGK